MGPRGPAPVPVSFTGMYNSNDSVSHVIGNSFLANGIRTHRAQPRTCVLISVGHPMRLSYSSVAGPEASASRRWPRLADRSRSRAFKT